VRWLVLVALILAGPASAQKQSEVERRAEDVLAQPVKDLGLKNERIDPLLIEAQENPYSLIGLKTCKALLTEIRRFDAVLGADIDSKDGDGKSLATRLADQGPQAIASTFIPFRGLLREATGAAEAERRARVAVASGVARRAFLKGVMTGKGCKRPQA